MLLVAVFTSCDQLELTIKNDCPGVQFVVSDGKYNVIDYHLMPGERIPVGLKGTAGVSNRLVINLDAYRISDGETLGSASRTFTVGSRDPTSVQQEAWNVSEFYPSGRCPVNRIIP
jgi:hypothetical protein